MKNLKKFIFSVILASLFIACSGSSSGNDADNGTNPQVETKTKLTVKTIEIK